MIISDQYNGYFKRIIYTFMIISCWILLRIRNAPGKRCRGKNTFLFSKVFFSPKNCAVYDVMWEMLQSGASHRWQYGACALRAGYLRLRTHSQRVTFIVFPLQQWVIERVNVRLYFTYCTLLVFLFLWTNHMFPRPPIMCRMAAELQQQVCRCADFQRNVLSLFVIHVQWGHALCP